MITVSKIIFNVEEVIKKPTTLLILVCFAKDVFKNIQFQKYMLECVALDPQRLASKAL